MFYNVVISDSNDYINCNSLVFHFEQDLEKAKEFCKMILKICNYNVQIIPIIKNESEE